MGTKNSVITDFRYIPQNGRLFIDTSAIFFINEDNRGNEPIWKTHKRVSSLCPHLVGRGDVYCVPEIISELQYSSGELKRMKRSYKTMKRLRRNDGHKTDIRYLEPRLEKALGKLSNSLEYLIDFLSEKEKIICREQTIEKNGLRDFIKSFERLSIPDKELVYGALNMGNGSGIFSADIPMIRVFEAGVSKFRLVNCFVSDAISLRTSRIS